MSLKPGRAAVSFVGTGNFARSVLLPAFARRADMQFRGTVAATGLSARSAADKFHFAYCSTDPADVWNDQDCNAVVIATATTRTPGWSWTHWTRQGGVRREATVSRRSRARRVEATMERLQMEGRRPLLMVGFNRRFGPAVES